MQEAEIQPSQAPELEKTLKMQSLNKKISDYKARILGPSFLRNLDPRLKKALKITAVTFVAVVVVLLVIFLAIKLVGKGGSSFEPRPTPTGGSEVEFLEIRNPSRYATDEEVLAIEAQVLATEKELNEIDLKESEMKPQGYNFDVSF